MIRINKKVGSAIPAILANKGVAETQKLIADHNGGNREFKFNPKIYGNVEVKQELIRLQHGKCCFCESQITAVAYGDVEHYRPKGGWIQDEEPINTPGYYWLAYEWNNLVLACQICNQQFKKNYFPIADQATRAVDHTFDISNEDALFIHPVDDDPEQYIMFDKYEVKAIDDNARGKVTISKLGLDRDVLNEKRKKALSNASLLFDLANGVPETNKELRDQFKEFVIEAQADAGEYASMHRCFFKQNPINF